MISKQAKLFEAGEFPDKDLEVTPEDLDRIIGAFEEVPVRVEHMQTPFDGALGVLKAIWRKGKELFGTIDFCEEAWALIEAAGAKKLSIGINRDKSFICEVSLVRHPRIEGAGVFSLNEVVTFESEIEEVVNMNNDEKMAALLAENEALRSQNRRREAQIKVDDLKRAGKIVPAAADYALAIFSADEGAAVTFGDGSVSLGEIFSRFLDAMPAVIEFREIARADDSAGSGFSGLQLSLFEKLGVEPEAVARQIGK